MRQSTYQRRLQDETVTPKGVVLRKYPHAVCRKFADAGSRQNHWGVYESDAKGAKLLGSTGTTATAWSTAAKTIWREERRVEKEAADRSAMADMREKMLHVASRGDILKLFELFGLWSPVTVEEFIEFLKEELK